MTSRVGLHAWRSPGARKERPLGVEKLHLRRQLFARVPTSLVLKLDSDSGASLDELWRRNIGAMSEDRYTQVLKAMSASVHEFAARLPPPQKVQTTDSFVFRYVERLPEQAIVQKLARYVSTLAAARLLMEQGFVQEQATLQRVLDELHEDIVFIALALCSDDMTDRHKQFLDAFYEEEFDLAKSTPLVQRRQMVSRDKIRAYNARVGSSHDPSGAASATRKVTKAYSGYVHAASPHIMDMYGGCPSRFHMTGMLGTPLHDDHRYDLWNYFYRGILAVAIASKAFGDVANYERVRRFALQFEAERGIAPD